MSNITLISFYLISPVCAFCQLLKALTPGENNQCYHGLFFQDGQRHVDYILTYPLKKTGGGRSSRQSMYLLTDNAVARSIRRGTHGRASHLQHHEVQKTRHSSHQQSVQAADVELGCLGENFNGHEDHKSFRREEFEAKLRDMGLELEKDEDVSLYSFICFSDTEL